MQPSKAEANATRYGVELYDDIQTLLESLSAGAPQTNAELYASHLDPYVRPTVETSADALHFRLGERTGQDVQIYATGTPDRPALGFKLTYSLTDDPAEQPIERREGRVTANGTCFYQETASEVISALALDKIEFTWPDTEGEPQSRAHRFFGGKATLGQRIIPYELRRPV